MNITLVEAGILTHPHEIMRTPRIDVVCHMLIRVCSCVSGVLGHFPVSHSLRLTTREFNG
jgi:hypothetical protein